MDKEYHRAAAKAHYEKYKESYNDRNQRRSRESREWIDKQKASTGCYFCPEDEPCALDYHHNNGDKDMAVSQMVHYNRQRLIEEIAKCVVLCANCHRKVHAGILHIKQPS